jgi:transposase-like protein
LHCSGVRLRDICEQLGGAPHSAVQAVLKKHGRKPHPRQLLRGQRLDRAIDLYANEGLTFRQVSERLGVAEWTVRHELANVGVKSRDRPRFVAAEEAQIIQRYDSGEPLTSIAKAFGCSEETIRRIILRNGRQMRPKRKLNPAIQSKIVEAYYRDAPNTSQMATEIGADRHAILRDGPELGGGRLDTRAFRNPSDDGCYWIGFLMADDKVMENGTLNITLQSSDRAHLEKLRAFLKSDAQIRDEGTNASPFKPGGTAVLLSVCSMDLVDDLKRWASLYRKTGEETLLQDEMSRHVWRGVIDGHGTVRVHKRGYLELRLYGSKDLCEQFRGYVLTLLPACRAKVCMSRDIYSFSLCCRPAETIARELYRDCATYLDRKFDVVARFLRWSYRNQ